MLLIELISANLSCLPATTANFNEFNQQLLMDAFASTISLVVYDLEMRLDHNHVDTVPLNTTETSFHRMPMKQFGLMFILPLFFFHFIGLLSIR